MSTKLIISYIILLQTEESTYFITLLRLDTPLVIQQHNSYTSMKSTGAEPVIEYSFRIQLKLSYVIN